MKKDTKVKKTHKPISIILPVVGGAALIGGATAGIVIGLGNTGKAVVAESKSATITPGEAEAEFVFDFKDDVKDNLVKAKITNPTKATNEDPGQVIFSNDTLKVEITLVDGKAATRVKLVNAPTEKGTYTYTFNIRFTYENMDGEDVAHEVNGLKLVYEAVEDRVEIVDPELSQLTKVAELNGQKQAYVTYTGFKYRGNLKKKDLTINGDFGTSVDTQTTFDFNAETKEISVNVRVDDGYAQNIHGSFTFLIDEEPMHVTNVNLTLTEGNLVTEPSDEADRIVFMDMPEKTGETGEVTATFQGFTFNGMPDLHADTDPDDTRPGHLFADWKKVEGGIIPDHAHIWLEVINVVNHKNTKKFDVKVHIWIDEIGVSWGTGILTGNMKFKYAADGVEEHAIDVPTDWFYGQEYKINMVAADTIIQPTPIKEPPFPIIKLDDNGHGTVDSLGWAFSGLKNMSEDELSGVFNIKGSATNFLTVGIKDFDFNKKTFNVEIGSKDANISSHIGETVVGTFQFYYSENHGTPVEIKFSGIDAFPFTFVIGRHDTITWAGGSDTTLDPVQIDTTGHVSVNLADNPTSSDDHDFFNYTGFEYEQQQKNVVAEVTESETAITSISLNDIAFHPETVVSPLIATSGTISGRLDLTIDPKTTTSEGLNFTVTFKYKDSDETINSIALKLPVTSADVIYDTDDSKAEEQQMTTDGKCVFTKTFKYSGLPEATTLEKAKALITFTNSTLKAGTKTPTYEIAAFDVTNKVITLNISFTGLDVTQTYEATGAIVFDYASTKFGSEELLISRDYHLTMLCQDTVNDDHVTPLKPEVIMGDDGKAELVYGGFEFTGFHQDPTLSKLSAEPTFETGALPAGLTYTPGTTSIVRTSNNTFDLHVPFTVTGSFGQDYELNVQSGATAATYYFTFTSTTSGQPVNIFKTDELFGGSIKAFGKITEPTIKTAEGTIRPDGTQTLRFSGFKTTGFESLSKRNSLKVSGFDPNHVTLSIEWKQEEDKSWSFDVIANVTATTVGYREDDKALTFTVGDSKVLYTTGANYDIILTDCIDVVEPTNTEVLLDYVNPSSYTFRFTGFQFVGFDNPSQLTVALKNSTFPPGTTATLAPETGTPYYTVSVITPSSTGAGEWNTGFQFKYGDTVVAETTKSYKAGCQEISVNISGNGTMLKQQVQTLTASVETAAGTITPSQDLTWTSSASSVASVKNGVVTAGNTTGTAYITAQSQYGVSNTFAINVVTPTVAIVFDGTEKTTLDVGETVRVYATVAPSTLSQEVIWSTNNKSVVDIKPSELTGRMDVTANGPGQAIITATSVADPTQSAIVTFTVNDVAITKEGAKAVTMGIDASLGMTASFGSWEITGLTDETKSLVTVEKTDDNQFKHDQLDWLIPEIDFGSSHQVFSIKLYAQAKTPSVDVDGLSGSVNIKYAGKTIGTYMLTITHNDPYLVVTDPTSGDDIYVDGFGDAETVECDFNSFTITGTGASIGSTYTDHVAAVAAMWDPGTTAGSVTVSPEVNIEFSGNKPTFVLTFTRHTDFASLEGKWFTVVLYLFYDGSLFHTSAELAFTIRT